VYNRVESALVSQKFSLTGGDGAAPDLYGRFTIFGHHAGMSDPDTRLALRQAGQARTDFAIIEAELEVKLARMVLSAAIMAALAGVFMRLIGG
jgi:hypothetical protein